MLQTENLSRSEYSGYVSWIAPDGVSQVKGCHFRARRSFDTDKLSDSKLLISAESYYALYVNGQVIGVGPARGICGCNFLDEYDLSDFFDRPTLNVAVEIFCNNFPTFIASPAEPAIFVSVGGKVCDESWQVHIAEDWRTDVPNYTFQIGLTEWRDYRKTPLGWQVFEDNSAWQQANVIESDRPIYAKKLFYRDVAPLKVTKIVPSCISGIYSTDAVTEMTPREVAEIMTSEKHSPLELDLADLCESRSTTIQPQPDGKGVVVILDPEQAYIGGFELDIEAPAGTIIDVGNDEELIDGRLTFKRCDDYRQADRYIHASGRHIISNPLHYRGGRYLQFVFRNFKSPITVHSLSFIDRRYPLDKTAEFECDDAAYNELWKRCVHTMSTCATDTFIDCPWREQAFWVNDFIVQSTYWLELTGNGELVRRSLDLAMSQRIDEGLIPGVCPFDGNKRHVLFATNLFLPIILRNYLRYTGDRKYVDAVLPTITDIFKCCQKYADDNGLLNPPEEFWNFVDWGYLLQDPTLQAYPLDGRNTCVVNWFNVLAYNALAELGVSSEAYQQKAKNIAAAIESQFWNNEDNVFYEWLSDDTGVAQSAGSLTHSLALLSGMLSSEKRAKVKVALQSDNLYHPELYMLHFVMEALAEIDEHSKISDIIQKYWLSMLKSDTPTIWEANVYKHGKEALWGLGSLCHAFALSPVNYFQKYILGIKPLSDGFKCFTFSPNVAGLNEASGRVPTPRGWIKIHWKIADGNMIANLDIPADTSAILPNGVEFDAGRHEIMIEKKN